MDIKKNVDNLKTTTLFPGFNGYFGWNYESAVLLICLPYISRPYRFSEHILAKLKQFPYSGHFFYSSLYLYSPGDRIGLFASLYKDIDNNIYNHNINVLQNWSTYNGMFLRNVGWGRFYGFRFHKVWLWADDVFIGGYPLLSNNVDFIRQMFDTVDSVLLDKTDGLYYHGALLHQVDSFTVNGVKWGRANAWILLMIAFYSNKINNEDSTNYLFNKLITFTEYQRPNGTWGNILNDSSSKNETSFACIYIYVVVLTKQSFFYPNAIKAWSWLSKRSVNHLHISDSAGPTHLSVSSSYYEKQVGINTGPITGLMYLASTSIQSIL
tara:strand:- start:1555 stop:2526 length:972 start_codon:yes stop_codon:yes gene_type:complete